MSTATPPTPLYLVLLSVLWIAAAGQQTGYLCTKADEDSITDDFFINLREDTKVGSVIQQLNINGDADTIELGVATPNQYVAFDAATRNLSLVRAVSREEVTTINMVITCKIRATQQTLEMQVILMIVDVNDNPPTFANPEISVNISELTPVGSTIVRNMEATDADADNWYITYEIDQSQPLSDLFSIPIPAKGEIVLQKPLDYERNRTISLRVLAKDNHLVPQGEEKPPQLTSTATVSINVLDGDDLNPVFLNTPYSATLIENEFVGATIPVVPPIQAVDQDSMNAPIQYSVQLGVTEAENFFTIDAVSGELRLTNRAIRRGDRFSLVISATQVNNTDRYATTVVKIHVTAANENAPRFVQRVYRANAVENTPIGSSVITVKATDNDQGAVLSYSFVNADDAVAFKIDALEGVVSTTAELDYEVQSVYNITIRVTDDRYFDEATLLITVVDLNDNAPKFNQTSYRFTAKRETGYILGQVKAVDRDHGSKVKYFLKDESQLFSIDKSGVIRVAGDPDSDLQLDEYTLLVAAVDEGSPSLEAAVPVYVKFDPPLAEVAAVRAKEDSDVNMIIIIVLGVIGGLLLVIVVILIIYIYKKNSFESQLNYERPVPTYLDDPTRGRTFKPRARHLAMYNNVDGADAMGGARSSAQAAMPPGTSRQDNPFMPDEDSALPVSRRSDPDYYEVTDSDKRYSSLSSMPSSFAPDSSKQMKVVNEIVYETSIAPADGADERLSYGNDSSSGNGSPMSSTDSMNGGYSTFRSGSSTQRLVTPKTTPKGTINKRPAVSFIDAEDHNMYNPQGSPVNPNLRNMPVPTGDDDRPGITLYY